MRMGTGAVDKHLLEPCKRKQSPRRLSGDQVVLRIAGVLAVPVIAAPSFADQPDPQD